MDWGCSAADRCGGEVKGCFHLNAGRSGRPGLAEGMLQPALAAGPCSSLLPWPTPAPQPYAWQMCAHLLLPGL